MNESEITEVERLAAARDTLKRVWVTYNDTIVERYLRNDDVRVALEIALDEIDLTLLALDAELSFELTDGNENDSQ